MPCMRAASPSANIKQRMTKKRKAQLPMLFKNYHISEPKTVNFQSSSIQFLAKLREKGFSEPGQALTT